MFQVGADNPGVGDDRRKQLLQQLAQQLAQRFSQGAGGGDNIGASNPGGMFLNHRPQRRLLPATAATRPGGAGRTTGDVGFSQAPNIPAGVLSHLGVGSSHADNAFSSPHAGAPVPGVGHMAPIPTHQAAAPPASPVGPSGLVAPNPSTGMVNSQLPAASQIPGVAPNAPVISSSMNSPSGISAPGTPGAEGAPTGLMAAGIIPIGNGMFFNTSTGQLQGAAVQTPIHPGVRL